MSPADDSFDTDGESDADNDHDDYYARCGAECKDGTPCERLVPTGGERCYTHRDADGDD